MMRDRSWDTRDWSLDMGGVPPLESAPTIENSKLLNDGLQKEEKKKECLASSTAEKTIITHISFLRTSPPFCGAHLAFDREGSSGSLDLQSARLDFVYPRHACSLLYCQARCQKKIPDRLIYSERLKHECTPRIHLAWLTQGRESMGTNVNSVRCSAVSTYS